ncbi:hypothetical protein Sme01_19530 [Sphaerisporangium melleum]|uniref:hypothetical protein n=1 Tax=Sphaerisporangium melleum TaxID=321316 RepID=UPI00194FFD36|nr:hypothetical protein [Sphaerisporangium melleum]GII69477.1 hypothetical protein Sme01_19530 [Sphaerisporangium melleum]
MSDSSHAPRGLFRQRPVRAYGPVIRPPGRADRLSAWARRIACVLPAVLGGWAAWRTTGVPAWLPAVAGLLVSGHVTVRMWAARGLLRRQARLRRWGALIVLAAGAALALSPVGGWLAGAWAAAGWATAYGGALLAAAVLGVSVVAGIIRGLLGIVARGPGGLLRVLAGAASVPLTVLLRCAWTPFLLAYVTHPDPRLAVPAFTLVVLEMAETVNQVVFGALTAQQSDLRMFHAPATGDLMFQVLRSVVAALDGRGEPTLSRLTEILDPGVPALRVSGYLGEWLYDGVLSRPRRPDRTLINTLCTEAHLTAGSDSADTALRRVKLAELALGLVEAEVTPRIARRHAARLARYVAIQRTACLWTRAGAYQYLGWEDEVLATWKECARQYAELGFPRMAAQARHTAWSRLLTRHRIDSVDLDHELLSPDDSPYLRRIAMLGMAQMLQGRGDVAGARRLAEQAAAVPLGGPREWFAWGWEQSRTMNSLPFTVLVGTRGHRNMEKKMRTWLSTRTMAPFPAWGNPIRDLVLRADQLAEQGRADEAARLFTEAASRARAAGQIIWEMNALTGLSQLARFVGSMDLARDSLLEALRSAEDLRGRAVHDELRVSAGGSITGLYDLAVWLFASTPTGPESAASESTGPETAAQEQTGQEQAGQEQAGQEQAGQEQAGQEQAGDDDEGGSASASPGVTAWRFAELARSRVLLELLGERLPAPALPEAATERAAYEAYVRLRDRSSPSPTGFSPEEAQALRTARDEWRLACALLAGASGGAAEYAALRLGRPIEFEELRALLSARPSPPG